MLPWLHLAAASHPDRVAIEGPERSLTYAELLEAATAAAGTLKLGVDQRAALALPPGEDFVIAFHACMVAGTAAEPKPVELTYENFQASALGSAVALGLDQAERWLCPMPLTHVGGLSIPVRSAIYATTAVIHGRFEVE